MMQIAKLTDLDIKSSITEELIAGLFILYKDIVTNVSLYGVNFVTNYGNTIRSQDIYSHYWLLKSAWKYNYYYETPENTDVFLLTSHVILYQFFDSKKWFSWFINKYWVIKSKLFPFFS